MTTSESAQSGSGLSPNQRLQQMIDGYRITQLIYVAAKLGIADLLEKGAKSIPDLAELADVHPQALYRVLRTLSSLGIFRENEDSSFELTPLAEPLQTGVQGSMRYRAIWMGEECNWLPWGNLLNSVKTGENAFRHVYDVGMFEYLQQHEHLYETFSNFMVGYTGTDLSPLLEAYDFSKASTIVDVGGGYGQFITAILKDNTEVRGILLDMPSVVEEAKDRIKAEGLSHRCDVIGGSFLDSVPQGDMLIIKSVIPNWDDENAKRIFLNCRRSLESDGRLLVINNVIPGRNDGSMAKLLDITMLAMPGGQERTEAEFMHLLGESGFNLTRVIPTRSPLKIIEAIPV